MLSVRMRLVLLMVCVGVSEIKAASIKKSISESTVKREIPTKLPIADSTAATTPTSPIPAIVAIEIVNGTDLNSSKPKATAKRTIESSLGYGYGSSLGPEPQKKFVIYKYSQQDIPPTHYNQFNGGFGGNSGGEYHLSSTATQVQHQQQPVYQAPPAQYYNPDTTLYTTLSHQGQLGGLSNNVPYQNLGHAGMVPVIILRVYTNQLSSPDTALHTNLPQSHPYSSLNNINLQSLLQNYVQQYLQSQQGAQQYQLGYQQLYQGHQQTYQVPDEYHSNLPTSENYPSKHHTRVIFHSNNNGHIPESPKSMFKTAGLSNFKTVSLPSYKASQPGYVEVQTPDSQYAYSSGSQYSEQPYMYIYPNQVDQDVYYQEGAQQYQSGDGQENYAEQIPPTATQDSQDAPHNYHAHPKGPSPKQRRSNKNAVVSSTLSPKRRLPRDKTT